MACLIVFTIFLNSFSFLMLLRMGWVSYQHDLYLSHTVYFMNSLTWADGISQEEKAHFLDMLFALPEMPELIEIEADSERFTSASLAQEEWQKQTGQNDLQLDGNWIILNRDEAKAQQLNVKDTIEEAGSIFNIAGIWDQQTIRGLSSIDSLAISSASSFSLFKSHKALRKQYPGISIPPGNTHTIFFTIVSSWFINSFSKLISSSVRLS